MKIRNNHGEFETRAIHAGQTSDPQNGAVMTPVYLTSTFEQDAPAQPRDGYEYSRTKNPTRLALEENLAALEGGQWGLCFASGLGATNALLDSLVPGDHVVAGNDLYGGTHRIFRQVFERYGIRFSFVDTTEARHVEAAIEKDTKLVYIESPSNPLLRVSDIEAISRVAKARSKLLVVDNTFASPYLQNPLAMGADVVLHSLTKYLGGHSDVVAGALVGNDPALFESYAFFQNSCGGSLDPMSSFLVLRGTKTLALRMQRHCENAMAIARFLEDQPQVARVHYPGLESFPQHELAKSQMRSFGGMVSFELKGGVAAGEACASATRYFCLAESLGGVESLIETPPSMTHAAIPAAERHAAGLEDGLVRLSVGVEHIDDLIGDLKVALLKAAQVSEQTADA
ncbi:MAG: cystathionine gamma-synthase [bacterium]|jgi:cystathionine gamma-lyase|nr:cystathionine gamma-synthase [Planctomycetota bacterium]HIL51362.1 cystathionine gamma-synthase [Planctomycetota bacterium]